MIRRKLLVATALLASIVLSACADVTAPRGTDTTPTPPPRTCPITSGSGVC